MISKAIIFALVIVALGLGYWMGSHTEFINSLLYHKSPVVEIPKVQQSPATSTVENGEKSERKVLYYRNPMGLPDISPVPKKDPMGMDYLPVYEGEEHEDDRHVVKISPARTQTLGVKTTVVEEHLLNIKVRAVGQIEVDERKIYSVSPRFEGWIERLYVSATGDLVQQGEPLFSVYSPDVFLAQQEIAVAESLKAKIKRGDSTALHNAHKLAQSARERLNNLGITSEKSKDSRSIIITSPARGIVLNKKVEAGMRFAPGDQVFRIADLSTVWVIADIYEQDLAYIHAGETATVILDALHEKHFTAKIAYLYPTMNASTRTTPVRLELANPEGVLRPGMFAHVEVAIAKSTPQLTVPLSAVIDNGDQQIVLKMLSGGQFQSQIVRLGMRDYEQVEILDGVQRGDQVVTSANFLIDAESNLKAALSDLTAQKSAPKLESSITPIRYRTEGLLDNVDIATTTVTISHNPIPELKWPAMTMDFNLNSIDMVKNIPVGSRIRFEFESPQPGQFIIKDIQQESQSTTDKIKLENNSQFPEHGTAH